MAKAFVKEIKQDQVHGRSVVFSGGKMDLVMSEATFEAAGKFASVRYSTQVDFVNCEVTGRGWKLQQNHSGSIKIWNVMHSFIISKDQMVEAGGWMAEAAIS